MRLSTVTSMFTLLAAIGIPIESSAQDLDELRQRANSDDARTLREAALHGEARATIIRHLEPNDLAVGGATFRVRRNPVGEGSFVYEPQTRFNGVERNLIWWVDGAGTPFAVNGPSQALTPALDFLPRQGNPSSGQIVAYVFDGEPIPRPERQETPRETDGFTVREYHAYRLVIDAPMSLSEEQAHRRAGQCLDLTSESVAEAVDKVQRLLFSNDWMGRPSQEIEHALNWDGEAPAPDC